MLKAIIDGIILGTLVVAIPLLYMADKISRFIVFALNLTYEASQTFYSDPVLVCSQTAFVIVAISLIAEIVLERIASCILSSKQSLEKIKKMFPD
jgi:hypothetical protein